MPAKTTKKRTKRAVSSQTGPMTVTAVMERRVQSARAGTKCDVIASLMIEGFGAVPVIDAKRVLVGIVSEHDLLAALDDGHLLGNLTAKDVMTANPYSVRPETTVATLVHVLRASDLVRVPVVDAKDRLVGIVARRDILRAYVGGRPARTTR